MYVCNYIQSTCYTCEKVLISIVIMLVKCFIIVYQMNQGCFGGGVTVVNF